jgi:hypothetical protein
VAFLALEVDVGDARHAFERRFHRIRIQVAELSAERQRDGFIGGRPARRARAYRLKA